jgi:hypothetical protein
MDSTQRYRDNGEFLMAANRNALPKRIILRRFAKVFGVVIVLLSFGWLANR